MPNETAVVVGAGGISKAWFGPLRDEQVDVRAVVDLDADRAREAIRHWQLDAEASDDLAAMLRRHRPDFVVDLTVPEAHCAVTCAALEAGCHVIGEKPMAASLDEARTMVAAAERTGKLYMVSQSRRWTQNHDRLRRAIAAGRIGRVTTVNCDFYLGAHFGGFRAEMADPLLRDMAIHHFDLGRYWTGLDPVAVYAHAFNPPGSWYAGNAAASCIFEMTAGAVFTYRGSWCAEGCPTSWNGDWRIVGTEGTLLYAGDAAPRGERAATGPDGSPVQPAGLLAEREPVDVPPSPLEREGMHGALAEMLRYLRDGTMPQTECHDNVRSLAMVFAALDSARGRTRVEVAT